MSQRVANAARVAAAIAAGAVAWSTGCDTTGEASVTLQGRILQPTGEPYGGLRLGIDINWTPDALQGWPADVFTDPDGRYEIEGVVPTAQDLEIDLQFLVGQIAVETRVTGDRRIEIPDYVSTDWTTTTELGDGSVDLSWDLSPQPEPALRHRLSMYDDGVVFDTDDRAFFSIDERLLFGQVADYAIESTGRAVEGVFFTWRFNDGMLNPQPVTALSEGVPCEYRQGVSDQPLETADGACPLTDNSIETGLDRPAQHVTLYFGGEISIDAFAIIGARTEADSLGLQISIDGAQFQIIEDGIEPPGTFMDLAPNRRTHYLRISTNDPTKGLTALSEVRVF